MNTLINEAYFKEQARKAGRVQLYGMLMVVASFLGSLFLVQYPLLVFISYPLLIVGFPMWQVGRGRRRRWVEEAKVPPLVAAELKGISTKHALYSYVLLPTGQLLDYLVVGPDGFYVIEMKPGGYQIRVTQQAGQDKWTEKMPFLEKLARLGEEALANPSKTLEANIAALKSWLADNKLAPAESPVYGVVAFRDPKTDIDSGDSEFEVLHLDELKSFIMTPLPEDESQPGARVPTDDRNRLSTALRNLMGIVATPPATAAKSGSGSKPAATTAPRTPAPARPGSAPSTPAKNGTPARPVPPAAPAAGARTTFTPKRDNTNGRKSS